MLKLTAYKLTYVLLSVYPYIAQHYVIWPTGNVVTKTTNKEIT